MKKEKTDYSILCYIGIFVCLVLIILPPLFRKILKAEPVIVVDSDYQQMNCNTDDNSEVIVVNYKGENNDIGQIKYTFVTDSETFRGSQLKKDMERSYNLSRRENEENRTMTYLLSSTGESGTLDQEDLAILSVELRQTPELQKAYYEQNGFKCSITKL